MLIAHHVQPGVIQAKNLQNPPWSAMQVAGAKRKAGSPAGAAKEAGQEEGRITSGNAYMLLYRRAGEASHQQPGPCPLPEE